MDDYMLPIPPMKGTIGNSIFLRGRKFSSFAASFTTCEVRTIGPALTLALAAASIFYDELRGDENLKKPVGVCFFLWRWI